jgi:hypothetical protein
MSTSSTGAEIRIVEVFSDADGAGFAVWATVDGAHLIFSVGAHSGGHAGELEHYAIAAVYVADEDGDPGAALDLGEVQAWMGQGLEVLQAVENCDPETIGDFRTHIESARDLQAYQSAKEAFARMHGA